MFPKAKKPIKYFITGNDVWSTLSYVVCRGMESRVLRKGLSNRSGERSTRLIYLINTKLEAKKIGQDLTFQACPIS